jgi:hypothetical protein
MEGWDSVPIGSPVGQNETAGLSRDHRAIRIIGVLLYFVRIAWNHMALMSSDVRQSAK